MFSLLLAIIYLSFISLGLPDSLLGSAWPIMYQEFNVPVSYMGIVSVIISLGTIISSLQSDRLTKWIGTAKVTAISVMMTAVALFGFSISTSFYHLLLWAIPYGLGAGSVDAALNNYVALHYESKHMSWLHCMWGVGASIGPYIMGYALTNTYSWNKGYLYISIIQLVLTICLFLSVPIWKKSNGSNQENKKVLSLKEILAIKGTKEVMIMFFCYCALESTTGLWASSYLVLNNGLNAEMAASYASLFYIGITIGRAISGFITMKLNDTQMIKLGQSIILIGLLFILFKQTTVIGLVLVGLGCAPIYPCIIHSTPAFFGSDNSQAIIGVQMASAYVGTCLMPPVFGLVADNISVGLLTWYLLLILMIMIFMHSKLLDVVRNIDDI
ncbi:MAG: MFS transporter [Erysipelotrichales bacterium]|nr:MFS transporter [Erysipelotrichales bacterium]